MFNYSFSEIALVALVALIAIGPERLPRVARAVGILFGRFSRYAATVKAEIDNELEKAQLKDIQEKIKDAQQQAQDALYQSKKNAGDFLNTPLEDTQQNTIHLRENSEMVLDHTDNIKTDIAIVAIVGVAGDPYSVRAKGPTRSQPIKSTQYAFSLDETPPTEAT
ncbi:MAG: twin arginine-targeting protein translocase TatB [Ferrovum sp. 37-45-19]|uniref:Sec-independent protein translocase protein TatB n=1 Tax=Ferrovum sp. JA12 TaxID=1356299 RepID=UPI000702DBB1|nr:Sec-independent protein translocase protein TatB [Ferrovum sp. JA12]OYV79630.1 MAG: twin arginine-targeting protein translocase TatB [Ferrovum sp. 21-44-67]OYV94575.1 MAG: twin arginine-targeting protein translocase TatB [Ferrovum sp. 37-45-19]OZB34596.1 MAG: twin arginine-targeting protein translocase TatB [Ferrovum sp. 34-44-207]HQT81557.1 Sec-independent protein translocase protein TatB [Ferrovaceae bacterium]KRH79529.1 Sec-independent protein translocase protein TatB [Ferrovum sp. JA12]